MRKSRLNVWAFLQMCEYSQAVIHVSLLLAIIAGLLIFSADQLSVLRYACVILSLGGLPMLVFALRSQKLASS